MKFLFLFVILSCFCWQFSDSIRCYQCTSDDDKHSNHDSCGVYEGFDEEINIPIECQGDESVTPGTFCVKITQQSPRGFIWDGSEWVSFPFGFYGIWQSRPNGKPASRYYICDNVCLRLEINRWRQVIRRCASVSDTGVTGVCNWGVYGNGVYWEECYCSEDSCNNSNNIRISAVLLLSLAVGHFLLS